MASDATPTSAGARKKVNRRQHILETLAQMLEQNPGERITTAALARQVGVTEAALYRHFPSKRKMFEGLIEFIEEALFSRIHRIAAAVPDTGDKLDKSLLLVLLFAQKNPGLCRVLNGDALTGEHEGLRSRVSQIYDRLEAELRKLLREAEANSGIHVSMGGAVFVSALVAQVEGRIQQFVRSGFKRLPSQDWPQVWAVFSLQLQRRTLA
ncbi:MAG: nucleoid occlusion factor SlmA [Hahellaceae bacterium]|nr:nucleoid occlusion factor SlmA [Hahellaceae bacterium]MCP5170435.1 nucleoid occlusion factor SlmA [Hahellaceae bacterium]